jgi:hypothetical protein
MMVLARVEYISLSLYFLLFLVQPLLGFFSRPID